MHAIYEYPLTVTAAEIDRLGHVNNRIYLTWMEYAAVAHSTANGWSPERYDEFGQAWVAKSHSIEYVKPAFLGDEVIVRTWISGFKRASSTRRYLIERLSDEVVLARAETNWAFINLKTMTPTRIASEVSECFVVAEVE